MSPYEIFVLSRRTYLLLIKFYHYLKCKINLKLFREDKYSGLGRKVGKYYCIKENYLCWSTIVSLVSLATF